MITPTLPQNSGRSCWLIAASCAILWWVYQALWGAPNLITWDVYGYYVYLPATFIYGDPVSYGFVDAHFANYAVSTNLYQLAEAENGAFAPIYTIGMAILWLPFFGIAHVVALVLPGTPADGLSAPYQLAVLAAALFYTVVGFRHLQLFLRRYFPKNVVYWCLAVLFLGTNLWHYTLFEAGMSHAYLFGLYAILLEFTARWHERPSNVHTIIIGVLVALLCLCRPSEGIALLIPLLYGLGSRQAMREKLQLVWGNRKQVILLAIVGVVCISPQVIYWQATINEWIFNGYKGHHFDWLEPHIWEGFFSYRKGWLLYTPVMGLSLLGFYFLYRQRRDWFWPVLVFFVLNVYIVLSWHIWWYAGAIGMRALIQSYAVLSLPLACFLAHFLAEKRTYATLLRVSLLFFVGLNLFQNWQFRNRILLNDEMTKTYYWNAFGKTEYEPEAYTYVDIDERFPDTPPNAPTLLVSMKAGGDCPQDTTVVDIAAESLVPGKEFSCTIQYPIGEAEAALLSEQWINVAIDAYLTDERFDRFRQARLVLSIDRAGEAIHYRALRLQRNRPLSRWLTIAYQTQLPVLQAGDHLKMYVWNTSPDTIYLHQLSLEHWKFE